MADKNETISIVIPVYNAEKYIEETLDTIRNQTITNYEIIIINDGSTDKSMEIINNYIKNNKIDIKVFEKENGGQSSARNYALSHISGKYLIFMDADDLLLENYLEVLYTNTLKYDADVVFSGFELFNEDNGKILEVRNAKEWTVEFENGVKHTFVYSPCGKIFKMDYIRKYDFKFSEGEQLEDGPYSMMVDILATKKIALDYNGYLYRQRSESTIGNTKKQKHAPKIPYRGIEEAILKVKNSSVDNKNDQVLEYCVVKILTGLVTRMYTTIDNKTRKELCEYCCKIMKEYFPNVKKNKHLKIFYFKKIPIVHRVAIRAFMIAYRCNMVYPFSLLVSKVL